MKVTKVAVNEIYPIVEQAMAKNTPAYKKNIEEFIKCRADDLYDTVPIRRIPFGADDVDSFFKAVKIDKNTITQCLSHTYYWNMNFNPRAAKDEFTMTQMMVIRYFILKNKQKEVELSSIYLAFSGKFYPSIHSQKFKIPPEKYRYVMEYVLNNMLTMKYDLKREGSVFGAVRSICQTWISTYTPKFKNPDDEDVADMIQQLHGRIKSFLGNIASAFYEAYEKKEYLTYGSESNDPDNWRPSDNDSLLVERIVENAITRVTTRGVDYMVCRRSSDSNVDTDELKTIIEAIQTNQDNLILIRELMRLIVVEYFAISKDKDIRDPKFISSSIVSKPNSKNKNVIRQKEIIENWLVENSENYRRRRKRPATESSYRKCIMKYYTWIIYYANLNK